MGRRGNEGDQEGRRRKNRKGGGREEEEGDEWRRRTGRGGEKGRGEERRKGGEIEERMFKIPKMSHPKCRATGGVPRHFTPPATRRCPATLARRRDTSPRDARAVSWDTPRPTTPKASHEQGSHPVMPSTQRSTWFKV